MKNLHFLLIIFLLNCSTGQSTKFLDGDIIFQTSKSNQSKALQIATKSKFSHMGIIYNKDGQQYVYEAVQPVKLTRLKDWINRGEESKYAVKRLKNASEILNPASIDKLKKAGEKFLGKNYDLYFEWSNEKIYCSELVWKMYDNALGIQIGKLGKMRDFDTSHTLVQEKIKERFGDNIPMDEIVISPVSMYNSDLLVLVYSNY